MTVTGYAQTPHLIDLGGHTGNAINNAGQVALDGAIYQNGVLTPLPPIPGGTVPMTADAINATGSVVGTAYAAGYTCSAAMYLDGALVYYGEPFGDPLLDCAAATGINASGKVVGLATVHPQGYQLGFLYEGGQFSSLPGFPGTSLAFLSVVGSEARGINDAGQVTGSTAFESVQAQGRHAFIYDGVNWTDLGPGTGYAINANGAVTGVGGQSDFSTTTNPPPLPLVPPGHAFLYSAGHMTDIGVLAGGTQATGYAINISEQVVGASDLTGSRNPQDTHAFFYNGVTTDMNALVSADDPLRPFVTLTHATGINDSRLIVVNGTDSRSGAHAYLLQGPWIDIAPGPLSFPVQYVGTVGSAQTVKITNSGTGLVSLGPVSISPNFKENSACGSTLAAGTNCAVQVTFAPSISGNLTGALTIQADGLPFVVPLSGDAPITASLATSATTAETGKPVTLTWTLSGGTTCTSSWSGATVTASGSTTVTQSTAGSHLYQLVCSAESETAQPAVTVTYSWPPVTVSISASPTSIAAGQSTQLTWTSANDTACTASGGGTGDGWPGSKSVSGSQTVMETTALAAAAVDLTFTLSCTSTISGLTTQAVARVKETGPSNSGGGGRVDGLLLLQLFSFLAAKTWWLTSAGRGHVSR